ncbi:DUF4124 domain-containing protein [Bacterioplanoides sp.]|uniref:DUF4124 domain-containing protein n=1 Tax=Bacterioplanoides sp. TaxID=2066072 RepID=UPI003B5CE8F5
MKKQLFYYLTLIVVFVEAAWFVSDPLKRDYFAAQIPIPDFKYAVKREVYSPLIPLMISALVNPPTAPRHPEVASHSTLPAMPVSDFDLNAHGVNACFKPLKSVAKAASEKIYRWVDANGKVHFGDGDRAKGNPGQQIGQQYQSRNKLTIDVSFQQARADQRIINELEFEARAIYRVLAGILPRELLRPLSLRILVFSNSDNLNSYKRQVFAQQDKGTAYQKDQQAHAYIVVKRAKFQGLRALRHELVHALVTAMAGSVPQWLGEGLAQYIEQVQWNMNAALVEPDRDDIDSSYLSLADTAKLLELKHSHFQYSISRHKNFRQAYALFFFLRSHSDGRRFIQKMFSQYRDWDCEENGAEVVLQSNYPGGLNQLHQRYLKWHKHGRFDTQRL